MAEKGDKKSNKEVKECKTNKEEPVNKKTKRKWSASPLAKSGNSDTVLMRDGEVAGSALTGRDGGDGGDADRKRHHRVLDGSYEEHAGHVVCRALISHSMCNGCVLVHVRVFVAWMIFFLENDIFFRKWCKQAMTFVARICFC